MSNNLKNILGYVFWISFLVLVAIWLGAGKGKQRSYNPDDPPEYEEPVEPQSERTNNVCNYEDGVHLANVEYYNPETGHSASYGLQVEVESCKVTKISFPKGGWLDDSHINPQILDRNGKTSIVDDKGRVYRIQIED